MPTPNILVFVVVGLTAQLIDGALGMAYGVSSTTFLLSIGVPPAAASASVHAAEIFISSISGLSHWRLGNVDKGLVKQLLIPGVIGGVVGAYLLTAIPLSVIKPLVSLYLLVMGCIILHKSFQPLRESARSTHLVPLGLVGGFFDAIGGGGWGPIVTTTLVATGGNPRFVVGSVNLAEFFVTVCESITFILSIGLTHWTIILGLIIGGAIAAPLAAYVCQKLPTKMLMRAVGVLIILLSMRTIYLTLLG
jgi:uncharacterized membrane protein YfcA